MFAFRMRFWGGKSEEQMLDTDGALASHEYRNHVKMSKPKRQRQSEIVFAESVLQVVRSVVLYKFTFADEIPIVVTPKRDANESQSAQQKTSSLTPVMAQVTGRMGALACAYQPRKDKSKHQQNQDNPKIGKIVQRNFLKVCGIEFISNLFDDVKKLEHTHEKHHETEALLKKSFTGFIIFRLFLGDFSGIGSPHTRFRVVFTAVCHWVESFVNTGVSICSVKGWGCCQKAATIQ